MVDSGLLGLPTHTPQMKCGRSVDQLQGIPWCRAMIASSCS